MYDAHKLYVWRRLTHCWIQYTYTQTSQTIEWYVAWISMNFIFIGSECMCVMYKSHTPTQKINFAVIVFVVSLVKLLFAGQSDGLSFRQQFFEFKLNVKGNTNEFISTDTSTQRTSHHLFFHICWPSTETQTTRIECN